VVTYHFRLCRTDDVILPVIPACLSFDHDLTRDATRSSLACATICNPVPISLAFLMLVDTVEKCIRLLCENYWGTGDDGWAMILESKSIPVPLLNQDTDETENNYSTVGQDQQRSDVSYDYICLGPELDSFIPTNSGMMLVREEYKRMVEHLTILRDRKSAGVVLTGRPGIGEKLP
jgi:hypothetical protein